MPRAPDSSAKTRTCDLTLPIQGALDFPALTRYQLRKTREPMDRFEEGALRRVLVLPGGPALVDVRTGPGRRPAHLEVQVLNRRPGDSERSELEYQAIRLYSLDFPQSSLEKLMRGSAPLAALARAQRGVRVAGIPDAFESLVWAILGQQVSLSVAVLLKRNLVEQCGESVSWQGSDYPIFPTARAILEAGATRLLSMGFSRPKARYVMILAEAVDSGVLDLRALRKVGAPERRERLQQLVGIGPWTANYVGLRSYGDWDALPLGDVGLEVAATRVYALEQRIKGRALEELAEQWRPFRGAVTFQLWFSQLTLAGRI